MPDNGVTDILLVEDDARDAELTLHALKAVNTIQRVERVSDGMEALDFVACRGAFAHRQPAMLPRLILLDLGLHKIGGLHVLRQLKADERTRRIPVIVLTASKQTRDVVESYQLGANSFVIKPTDARKFQEAVASIGQYWLGVNETPPL